MLSDAELLLAPGVAADAVTVEIDADIPGHIIQGRCDWLIRGRILSESPAEQATLLLDNTPLGRMGYGRSGAHTIPEPDNRFVAVFHLHLSVPLPRAATPCTFQVLARTRDGCETAHDFTLAPAPDRPDVAHVSAGRTHPITDATAPRPHVVLYVEHAARDPRGRLVVHGWSVAFTPLLMVQVLADGKPVGSSPLSHVREDVAAILPMYPNARKSGFAVSLPGGLAEDAEQITVRAITQDGFMHELVRPLLRADSLAAQVAAGRAQLSAGTGGTEDRRRKIHYHWDVARLDEAGGLFMEGWAVCAAGIISVAIEVEGQPPVFADLGGARPDVGEQFPEVPLARLSGFRLHKVLAEAAAPVGTGREIRITVRNGLDDMAGESRIVLVDPASRQTAEPQAGSEAEAFRLEIDSPAIVAGIASGTVTGRLTIDGWAVARAGIAGIDVLLDGAKLGEAHVGLARQDVGAAHPDWEGALRSGYAFHCPPRALADGAHDIALLVRARDGATFTRSFAITVSKAEQEEQIGLRRRLKRAESDLLERVIAARGAHPRFHLLIPVAATTSRAALDGTLRTLAAQAYADWRLTLVADKPEARATARAALDDLPALANPAAVASPARARIDAKATLAGVLAPGDELGCDALLEIALAAALDPAAEFLYADDIRANPSAGGAREPFFKPDFSPDLLLSANYIGRTWFATPALLAHAGLDIPALVSGACYDAVLRLTEAASRIRHLPKLLAALAPSAEADERAALAEAAHRRRIAAEIAPGIAPGTWRFRRTLPAGGAGLVSIIIPTCAAHGHIKTCIETLRANTAAGTFETVCIENIPESEPGWKTWLRENADAVVSTDEPFNWSRFNNLAARAAKGAFLLFLNDDIEITGPGWLDTMLAEALRPEVGVVGARLLFADGKVQHAGMFLAEPGIGRHAFRFAAKDEPGYFGLALTQRNVSAVTGACMMVRRDAFEALGGFDETHAVINNDLDYCLRAREAGQLVVFTPHATLIHHEFASREDLPESFDRTQFLGRWSTRFAAGDPYLSPRLSRHEDDYQPDEEPPEPVVAGPLFRSSDIGRILVVKLDHIGDVVTALPAIRHLKQRFPDATLHLLTSPANRALAEAEPAIDEVIAFQFFHARSELGPLALTDDDLAALRARLAPYRFDLAIDLRKHPDTRDMLRQTGARYLAGFDHLGRFPFLDIAMEWDTDRALQRKRGHVGTDLVALVDAVAAAGSGGQPGVRLALAPPGAPGLDFLPEDARPLFAKPVVIVHPGVGTVMRQWPAAHFAALIDLLVERAGVNAVIIGGPEEQALGEEVLGMVANGRHVASLIGRTKLADLPRLLSAGALYVGNNSGPKHIAAALGTPTIGIHSGVVDAIEWAPLGPAAIALRRNMHCSPCYIARAEDCPRQLACLRGLEPDAVLPYAEALLALGENHGAAPAATSRPRSRAPAKQTRPGRTRR